MALAKKCDRCGKLYEHSALFIALENVFRSKGHDANKVTELAYEAMDELESWYEEKMEEIDDEQ